MSQAVDRNASWCFPRGREAFAVLGWAWGPHGLLEDHRRVHHESDLSQRSHIHPIDIVGPHDDVPPLTAKNGGGFGATASDHICGCTEPTARTSSAGPSHMVIP